MTDTTDIRIRADGSIQQTRHPQGDILHSRSQVSHTVPTRYLSDATLRSKSANATSHILARLGQAERIGNLVGQFEFTDEQLAATQKGLQGVSMPNFGDAKANLAKEASWEPEEPEETEDESEFWIHEWRYISTAHSSD